ncbi:DoxX family protein [Hyphomicrobium sp. 2TAF46]
MKALVVLFLCFDAVIKIMFVPDMPEASAGIGWDAAKAPLLGVILLASTLLYAVPRTSVLGAILLTGYLGGAVATHMRVDSPLFTHVLFGIYLGLFMWGGLWLRDPRLRSLFPLRRSAD